jgi:hypothetical protein
MFDKPFRGEAEARRETFLNFQLPPTAPTRGPTLPGNGDKLVADQLCPMLHWADSHSEQLTAACCPSAFVALLAGAGHFQFGFDNHATRRL